METYDNVMNILSSELLTNENEFYFQDEYTSLFAKVSCYDNYVCNYMYTTV